MMDQSTANKMRVSFDLDEVLFVSPETHKTEPALIFPLNLIFKERLRLGTPELVKKLQAMGYDITEPKPALCPVPTDPQRVRALKGIRVRAAVSAVGSRGVMKTETGELQFTEQALSGICVFDLSLFAKPDMRISLDLLPDISEKELYNILLKNKILFANHTIDNLLTGILQKRIAQAVLKSAGVKDFSRSCSTLGDGELGSIAKTAKSLGFTVTGNAGFDRAQACRGGVLCGQIDPVTMQSLLVKNLYFCGEALDVCGECGGYNLHFAFAGGIIAGESL